MNNTENRIAVIAVIVENEESTAAVNEILHEKREHIVGRMGLPYRTRGVNVISVVFDAPVAVINAVAGRLSMVGGVSAKPLFSNK